MLEMDTLSEIRKQAVRDSYGFLIEPVFSRDLGNRKED
jgi:hypothetical protein